MRISNKKSNGNRLSTIDKIAVKTLLSYDKSPQSVADQTGVSPQTVLRIRDNDSILPIAQVEAIKKSLTGNLYKKAHEAIYNITQDKFDKASALQLMTIAGIGIDKARLMNDQSTMNVSMLGTYNTINESFDKFSKQFDAQFTSDNHSYEAEPPSETDPKVTGGGEESK